MIKKERKWCARNDARLLKKDVCNYVGLRLLVTILAKLKSNLHTHNAMYKSNGGLKLPVRVHFIMLLRKWE